MNINKKKTSFLLYWECKYNIQVALWKWTFLLSIKINHILVWPSETLWKHFQSILTLLCYYWGISWRKFGRKLKNLKVWNESIEYFPNTFLKQGLKCCKWKGKFFRWVLYIFCISFEIIFALYGLGKNFFRLWSVFSAFSEHFWRIQTLDNY